MDLCSFLRLSHLSRRFRHLHRLDPEFLALRFVDAGFVGSTTAYALMMSGMAAEIVLTDRDSRRAEGHVNDLRDAEVFSHTTRIFAGDFSDCCSGRRDDHHRRSQPVGSEVANGRVTRHGSDTARPHQRSSSVSFAPFCVTKVQS